MRVRAGFFRAFKGADTLLLDGDAEGLAQLSQELSGLATERADQVTLLSFPFVERHYGVQVSLVRGPRDVGVSLRGTREFTWLLSTAGWSDVVDLLEPLIKSGPGHQYLDQFAQITVMASREEYDDAWWAMHG